MYQVSSAKAAAVKEPINTNYESFQSENVEPCKLGFYDKLENIFRFLFYLM